MAISLYDATVAGYLQILGAVSNYLDKGMAHCKAGSIDPAELVNSRLHPDMLPLAFQIASVRHHSLGAIEGCKSGVFTPPPATWTELDYAGLQNLVTDTAAALGKFGADEINGLEGRDLEFHIRELKVPYTAEGFLLSFSIPNFHFHATTGYDILRGKGVKIGKRDYLGRMRTKT